jgi:hypothetical protein
MPRRRMALPQYGVRETDVHDRPYHEKLPAVHAISPGLLPPISATNAQLHDPNAWISPRSDPGAAEDGSGHEG